MVNENLRQARKKHLWTLQQAAIRAGVSFQTYIRWEHGTQKPHLSTLATLCNAFDMTAEELGFGELVGAKQETGFEYYTCFIAHSSENKPFVLRLLADLESQGVLCWYAPEDLMIGDNFVSRIDESIRTYDKVLLVLSEHSVASPWVAYEVKKALDREVEQEQEVLFPIRIDNAVLSSTSNWADSLRSSRHIGDFTRWKEHGPYHKALTHLLRTLKVQR